MASFQKYSTKQGQMWLFKMDTGINPETGKRQTTTRRGFKTKKEALVAAAQLEQEVANGVKVTNNNLTFEAVYLQWFEVHSKTVKISTKNAIMSKFKKQILPRLGKFKIKDITKLYCQQVINDIAEEIKSVNDMRMYANQVFKHALRMDIISKNPMEHVIVPKPIKDTLAKDFDNRNYWKKDEIKRFLSYTEQQLPLQDHVLFQLLIYTGARKGELLSLAWEDIDFTNGFINLGKTLYYDKGKAIFQTTKTGDFRRLISLDSKTLTLLKKWRIKQNGALIANKGGNEFKDLVFSRENGSPLRLAYLNEKLSSLIKKLNLHKINIHGFRHTHASLLFEAGANIKEVQERLGHSDIKMTMDTYTHVTNTVKEQTAEKFSKYMQL
jgi:integrase